MPPMLVVPIQIDALALSASQSALDAFADFSLLPWVAEDERGAYDVGGDRPFLTETIAAPPFGDTNTLLHAGIHLHWALPTALTRATHPLHPESGQPQRGQLAFPAAPNRWLLCRRVNERLERAWVRESDYLWHPHDLARAPETHTIWPASIVAEGDAPGFVIEPGTPPFRAIGRSRELGQPWPQAETPTWLKSVGQRLTAVGYGETNFAAFYPNCRTVFGHHDQEPPPAEGLWYELFGWYDDPRDDPLHQLVTRLDPAQPLLAFVTSYEQSLGRSLRLRLGERAAPQLGAAAQARLGAMVGQDFYGVGRFVDALTLALGAEPPLPLLETLLRSALSAEPAALLRDQIRQQLGWDWPEATLPDRLLCYGRIQQTDFTPALAARPEALQVAVATSGSEALAALVATHLAEGRYPLEATLRAQERSRLEAQLDALLLASELRDDLLDVGEALEIARHRRSFTALPGSQLWVIRPRSGGALAQNRAAGQAGVRLSPALAHLLDGLNAAQAAYDQRAQEVESLQAQTYADWYRTMLHSYPGADELRDYVATERHLAGSHDLDAMYRHLRRHSLHELTQALAGLGEIISLAPGDIRIAYHLSDTTCPAAPGHGAGERRVDMVRALALQRRDGAWQSIPGSDRSLEFDLAAQLGPDDEGPPPPPQSQDTWRLVGATGRPTTLYRVGGWWQTASGNQALPVCLALELAHYLEAVRAALTAHNDDPPEVTVTTVTLDALHDAIGATPLAALLPALEGWRGRRFATRAAGESLKEAFRRALAGSLGQSPPEALYELLWSLLAEQWSLDQHPGPRFWQPNDPVLLLAGKGATPTDRWQHAGTPWHDEQGALGCCSVPSALVPLVGDDAAAERALLARMGEPAARQQWAQVATALRLDQREGGRIHPFMLEWEAQFAAVHPGSNREGGQTTFDPDYLERHWALDESEHTLRVSTAQAALTHSATTYRGRAPLSSHAHPALTGQLERYLLFRLQEPSIPTDRQSGAPLSYAEAATRDPETLTFVSWLAQQAPHLLAEGRAPAPGSAALAALFTERQAEIAAWARSSVAGRDLMAGVQALTGFQAVNTPPALRAQPRCYGLPDRGGLAEGLLACLHHALSAMPDTDAFLRETIMLSEPVIARLLVDPQRRYASLQDLDSVIQAGAAPFIRLLRCADGYGYLLPHPNRLAVLSQPSVLGLPEGGAIQQILCALANSASAETLAEQVGLRVEAIEAIVEARGLRPFAALSALASLPAISAATFARLLVYADQQGHFHQSSSASPPATTDWHVWADEYGHARVDALETTLSAWVYLQDFRNVLTQSMSGFHDALLMRAREWSLPVADPLAFDDYRAFTEQVIQPAVGRQRRAPRWANDFHPLRAGDLSLVRLRLVDTFGQTQEIDVEEIRTPTAMQTPRGHDMALPPRLAQAARLNLRWLAADGSGVEWNSHPATTPICGWLIVNTLTTELAFYDGDGVLQGILDLAGQWRLSPGATSPVRPDDLDNPTLRQVVRWVQAHAQAEPDFIATFADMVETALEAINPEGFQQQDALALLMSRPVAIVRLQASFELQQPPATRQSLDAFAWEVQGGERQTDGFETVRLPLRIGEHRRANDGVIAYWVEAAPGRPTDERLHTPQSHWSQSPEGLSRDMDSAPPLGLSLAEPPLTLTMLLDPRGSIHATSGLLPVKVIELSADLYAAALERIEVNFLTAPILTPRGHIQIPLPHEPGWRWSWIGLEAGRVYTLPDEAILHQAVIAQAFPGQPLLWGQLLAAGILETIPGRRDAARIRPDAFQEGLLAFDEGLRPDLQRVLEMHSQMVERPESQARFAPVELREGWLRLQRAPAPDTPPPEGH